MGYITFINHFPCTNVWGISLLSTTFHAQMFGVYHSYQPLSIHKCLGYITPTNHFPCTNVWGISLLSTTFHAQMFGVYHSYQPLSMHEVYGVYLLLFFSFFVYKHHDFFLFKKYILQVLVITGTMF